MTLQDGDTVLLENRPAEIVGVRLDGYDVVRYFDNRVFRNVNRDKLTPVSNPR